MLMIVRFLLNISVLECVNWKEGIIITRNFFSIFIEHIVPIQKTCITDKNIIKFI